MFYIEWTGHHLDKKAACPHCCRYISSKAGTIYMVRHMKLNAVTGIFIFPQGLLQCQSSLYHNTAPI